MSNILSAITGMFSSIKSYFYLALVGTFLVFVGWFVWRGYEISGLQVKLEASQQAISDYQTQIQSLTKLREQELKTRQEADKRADEIRNTPKKDDGPVSRVLSDSLRRL